jgi:hypothetical protein
LNQKFFLLISSFLSSTFIILNHLLLSCSFYTFFVCSHSFFVNIFPRRSPISFLICIHVSYIFSTCFYILRSKRRQLFLHMQRRLHPNALFQLICQSWLNTYFALPFLLTYNLALLIGERQFPSLTGVKGYYIPFEIFLLGNIRLYYTKRDIVMIFFTFFRRLTWSMRIVFKEISFCNRLWQTWNCINSIRISTHRLPWFIDFVFLFFFLFSFVARSALKKCWSYIYFFLSMGSMLQSAIYCVSYSLSQLTFIFFFISQ